MIVEVNVTADVDDGRRWLPAFDEATLKDTIKRAVASSQKTFYLLNPSDPEPCQGDVLELETQFPLIDSDGDPAADDSTTRYWLVVANSCDIARTQDDENVLYVPVVPLHALEDYPFGPEGERDLFAYNMSRLFLVPSWNEHIPPHVADFSTIVPMHRVALRERAKVSARMRLDAWVLLNACLVRVLCREDRRNT